MKGLAKTGGDLRRKHRPGHSLLNFPKILTKFFLVLLGMGLVMGLMQPHPALSAEDLSNRVEGIHQGMDQHDQDDWAALKKYLQADSLSPALAGVALLLAAGLGALHALSPGHGKGMVAAYLIGSRGRIKDAVFLGGVMTFTHVVSVIILGLVALFLSQYVLPEDLFPWLGVFSGALVFLVGYWMLAQRALHAVSHTHHHHGHGHHHPHSGSDGAHHHETPFSGAAKDQKGVSWRSLLSLGVAGGLVPCPTALVVLLAAVALNRISLGLLMILFFSLGLAAVLILIGILTVTASKLTARFSESQAWIQKAPIFSAGVVMVVGISIAFNAVKAAGIITVNI